MTDEEELVAVDPRLEAYRCFLEFARAEFPPPLPRDEDYRAAVRWPGGQAAVEQLAAALRDRLPELRETFAHDEPERVAFDLLALLHRWEST